MARYERGCYKPLLIVFSVPRNHAHQNVSIPKHVVCAIVREIFRIRLSSHKSMAQTKTAVMQVFHLEKHRQPKQNDGRPLSAPSATSSSADSSVSSCGFSPSRTLSDIPDTRRETLRHRNKHEIFLTVAIDKNHGMSFTVLDFTSRCV